MKITCPHWSNDCCKNSKKKELQKPCFFAVGEIMNVNDLSSIADVIRLYQYVPKANYPFQLSIQGGFYETSSFYNTCNNFEEIKKKLDNAFKECFAEIEH